MSLPDFSFEQLYWNQGHPFVIGVDEVGRGALAGPVVAGAACFARGRLANSFTTMQIQGIEKRGIDDSKRLTSKQREKLVPFITKLFHTAFGEASVEEINQFGIVKATHKAMRRAIKGIMSQELGIMGDNRKTFLLIDGFPVPQIGIKQQSIIRGDQQSISIAAASIVAKVYRDNLMKKLASSFQEYGWETNVGYGTPTHLVMIGKYGISPLHRDTFIHV